MRILEKITARNADISTGSPATIVFLGDSITQGAFELTKSYHRDIEVIWDYDAVYHNQFRKILQLLFPDSPIHIINAGISANDARQGYNRLDTDVLPFSPDLVVVCFGLNDVREGIASLYLYVDALKKIFRELKEKEIETIFMTPNMLNTYLSPLTVPQSVVEIAIDTAKLQNEGVMDAYMEAANSLCREEGIPVCDCYGKWKKLYQLGVDTTRILSNHINHPTREMHKLFAAYLVDMIVFR